MAVLFAWSVRPRPPTSARLSQLTKLGYHGPQRMSLNDFGDSLTFCLKLLSDQKLTNYLKSYWPDLPIFLCIFKLPRG